MDASLPKAGVSDGFLASDSVPPRLRCFGQRQGAGSMGPQIADSDYIAPFWALCGAARARNAAVLSLIGR